MSKTAKIWTVIGVIVLIILVTVVYQLYKHHIALPEDTYTKMPSATYTTPEELHINDKSVSSTPSGDSSSSQQ